jgi:hypothetical protein
LFSAQNKRWIHPDLIDISMIGEQIAHFSENLIREEETFKRAGLQEKKGNNYLRYFSCLYAEIRNCTFLGITNPVRANLISECCFKHCTRAIDLDRPIFSNKKLTIDNCVFEECTNVMEIRKDACISNCQFVSCYGSLIYSEASDGGISVEFCQFINTKNLDEYSEYKNSYASITFWRSGAYGSKTNYLKKCIFDGVVLGDNFLIAATGYKRPYDVVTRIEDCDFRNCLTKRASGQIIKEYLEYDGLLKKNQRFHANIISECRGLDKINKEYRENENVEIKTTSTTGNTIGTALAIENNFIVPQL